MLVSMNFQFMLSFQLTGLERGPKKVETKLVQGPVLQRPALGEVSNRNVCVIRPRAPLKPQDVTRKQPIVTKPVKPKNTSSISLTR